MLTTLFLSLFATTVLFIVIAKYQYVENIKQTLIINNQLIIKLVNNEYIKEEKEVFNNNFKNIPLRFTYIDKEGKVLFDSMVDSDTMENHLDRKEVVDAKATGSGSSIRFSTTVNKDMIYMATEFNDGYIMRSSIPLEIVSVFSGNYLKYYLLTLVFVIIMAIFLSYRLVYLIVEPIKELEYITSHVANGEFSRRYKVHTNDEVGQLGKTFNNMAERLQITLRESLDKQNRLEAILKSMDSGVIAIDRAHNIIMINPYAKKIFGINKDIIGKNLMDSIRDIEFENVFINTDDNYNEIKILWPSERFLRVKTADIINEKIHIGTVAVVQDITDLKRLEKMRTEFVANVSHELKTPLTSIKGFAETLMFVEDTENKEKFLNIINDEAERLTRLINDILALSDIELHKEEKQEIIDVNQAINDVFNLMRNTAEKKNITISLLGEKVNPLVGDRDQFMQMLINLVDNAIKYSEINDNVYIGTTHESNNCLIWVEDSGVGIPKEHIPRLFERFYRVDKARSRARGGTGLGLAIVKHIVLGFRGTIEIESELSIGSKFIVKIPY